MRPVGRLTAGPGLGTRQLMGGRDGFAGGVVRTADGLMGTLADTRSPVHPMTRDARGPKMKQCYSHGESGGMT